MTNVPKGWHIDSRTWEDLMMGDPITFIIAGPWYYFMCCVGLRFGFAMAMVFDPLISDAIFCPFLSIDATLEIDRKVFFSSLLWNSTTNVHQCCESRRGLLSFLHEFGLESATIHTMNLLHIFMRMTPRVRILECWARNTSFFAVLSQTAKYQLSDRHISRQL